MNLLHARLMLGLLLLVFMVIILRAATLQAMTVRNTGVLAFNHSATIPEVDLEHLAVAESRLATAVTLNPAHQSSRRLLGYAYLARGQEDAALDTWRKVSNIGIELVDHGRQLEEDGDLAGALQWYERAAAVQPDLPDGWRRAGAVLELNEAWQAAIDTYAAGADASNSSDLYFLLANALLQHTDPVNWAHVLSATEQAITLNSFNGDYNASQVHYVRGLSLLELGQPAAAKDSFLTVLKTRPDHYWTNIRLGRLVWELDGDAAAAETFLRAAIASNRNSKWAYRDLAALMMSTGRQADAVDLYGQVLKLDPDDSIARERLAELRPNN